MTDGDGSGEPLTWGVVANVSRDVFTRRRTAVKRPGTRHFVPGAKVWVLPVYWGDGGQHRYVIGVRRGSGGRSRGPALYDSREDAHHLRQSWKSR